MANTTGNANAAAAASQVGEHAHRILLVDDNVEVADSFAHWLTTFGQDVRTALSGEKALVEAASYRPEIMFIDIGLPGMNGHETARNLRRMPELEGVVLIAVTGYGRDEDRRLSFDAGFDEHWVKPFGPEVLTQLLATLQGPRRGPRRASV